MSWDLSLEELAEATHGEILSKVDEKFSGIGSDSRSPLNGKIFFALTGANFDAHEFLNDAHNQKASCLVVSHLPDDAKNLVGQITILEVPEVLRALQSLALFWRHKMNAKILAVTGTNGKTTTKEFAATLISQKYKTQWSKGSFNNHWGVPLSLLSIHPEHEVAVIEMGMNHAGEIGELVGMSDPNVVLVTMVGRGHLEGLGSINEVATAKNEMYSFAPDDARPIFNIENQFTRKMFEDYMLKHPEAKPLLFCCEMDDYAKRLKPDVNFKILSSNMFSLRISGQIQGTRAEVDVPVFGEHNVYNLMAATALALSVGMTANEIWSALPKCQTSWGRSQWLTVKSGAHVLFDAYNANPESMKVAIDNFAKLRCRGRKIAFLGEMREMGQAAGEVHRELGAQVGALGFDHIVFVGPSHVEFEAGVKSSQFQNNLLVTETYKNNLALSVQPVIDRDDLVLIKASRGMELERILEELGPVEE
jgi:UDP-N-acetylmuramoyl-tripeptide--D-alanyl-D-alanine ligase